MTGMFVRWGDFDFAPEEAVIALSVDNNYSTRGFPLTSEVRFTIDGEVFASDEYTTEERLLEIQIAFNSNYHDISYRHSDGTPSVHSLANDDPNNLTGNRILSASYPLTVDGEYVSGRKFRIGIGATLRTDGISNVMSYKDNLHFTGDGGPITLWPYDERIGYYPLEVSPTSMQRIVHYGEKVTSDDWHLPPTPFRGAPYEDNTQRQVWLEGPIVYPNGMLGFVTKWSYVYQLPGVSADFLRPRTGYL